MSHKPIRRPAVLAALLAVVVVVVAVAILTTRDRTSADATDAAGSSSPASGPASPPTPSTSASRDASSTPSPTSEATTSPTRHPTTGSRTGPTTAPRPGATPSASSGSSPGRRSATGAPAAPPAATQRPRAIVTKPPQPFDQPARFGNGVTVTVQRTQVVRGTGRGPGEISGPSVRVSLTVSNGSSAPVDLDGSTVNAYYGAATTPAPALTGDPSSHPLSGTLRPGARAQGVYVFRIAPSGAARIRLELSYAPTSSVVAFTGAVGS